ncbi:MAG: MBL fold metallo-hydrolase, partial [Odoribacter sp.]
IPVYILLTHEHFDHIWGVEKLREKYDCKVISSFNCSSLITDPKKNLSLFYDQKGFRCSPADMIIEDLSNPMNFQSYDIYFYNTPGHSSGSICIKIKNYLFTGDTLMENMKTPTKLPGGDQLLLQLSLDFIVCNFPKDTIIFPGHGNSFLLKQ